MLCSQPPVCRVMASEGAPPALTCPVLVCPGCLVCPAHLQELRDSFQTVAQAAAEAAYFSGQEAQGGVLAHLAAKLAAKLKVGAAAAHVLAWGFDVERYAIM